MARSLQAYWVMSVVRAGVLASVCSGVIARAGDLVLVEDGHARAVIVVAGNAAKSTKQAASTFQQVVRQMTGVALDRKSVV